MNVPRDFQTHIDSMMGYSELLQKIHDSLPLNSPERDAVLVSAKALVYVMHQKDFQDYLIDFDKALTKEQLDHLQSLGLDVHTDTEDE